MVDATALERVVCEAFPDAKVEVRGGDGRFEVMIVSDRFRDLSRVQRQQLVYACLTEYIREGSVHAVTIRARTADESS